MLAYTIVALFGAGLSFLVVNQLGGSQEIIRTLGWYDFWVIVSGSVGAASGLFIGRRWLGHRGFNGILRALAGMLVISFTGSLVGGTLSLPIYGTMFGPLALAVTLYENTMTLGFWLFTLAVTHVLFLVYRSERETLFQVPDTGIPA